MKNYFMGLFRGPMIILMVVFVWGCGGSATENGAPQKPAGEVVQESLATSMTTSITDRMTSIQNKVLAWVGLSKNSENLPEGMDKNGYRTLVTIKPYDPCLDRNLCPERKQKKETEEDRKYSLPPLNK